jgi:hypothetical protein
MIVQLLPGGASAGRGHSAHGWNGGFRDLAIEAQRDGWVDPRLMKKGRLTQSQSQPFAFSSTGGGNELTLAGNLAEALAGPAWSPSSSSSSSSWPPSSLSRMSVSSPSFNFRFAAARHSEQQSLAPNPNPPSYTGHPRNGYHWERPFPRREAYPEGAYTLSGGIFESVVEGTCQRRAQHSKSGWCQPPCQLMPETERKLSASKRDTKSCLVMLYSPGVRADQSGKASTKHKLDIDSKTRDIGLGSCPCVDPCSLYTTCGECTANKDAAEIDENSAPHFTGGSC